MKGLNRVREGADFDEVIEDVVAARRVSNDPKELFGGPRDWIDSGIPPIAFLVANLLSDLRTAVYVALAAAAVMVAVRLVRRETLRHAFSGVFGVAIAAAIAARTGKAENFFLPGIIINVVYGGGFLLSALFGKPLVGVIMRMVLDRPKEWHDHPVVRRAYVEATFGWAAVFLVRATVQEVLRRAGELGLLTAAKLAMGWPLYLAALALTLPYVKWRAREVPVPASAEGEAEGGGEDAEDEAAEGVADRGGA
ncbi:MAG TPA: DUF3159 domain-containing protein [Frankiaceae bacterium]|nr:DUF3159 domain-containing protein [Frankiaceae bacterium]